MHDRSQQQPPGDRGGDWAWDWDRAEGVDITDPSGIAPTAPGPAIPRPDVPRLASWSRPLCILGSAALATVVALVLTTVPLRIELPTGGTNRRPSAPNPVTAGIAGPRDPAPSTPSTTTTSAHASGSAPTTPATAAPRPGTITHVAPSPPPTEPATAPESPPPPPPEEPGGGGLIDDLLT